MSVSVFIFVFCCFFFKNCNQQWEVFIYSKLILLKLPDCRLFCPQQSSKHIKVPPSSQELRTWWLFVQNHRQHTLLGIFYFCDFFLQIWFFSVAFIGFQFSQCVAHTHLVSQEDRLFLGDKTLEGLVVTVPVFLWWSPSSVCRVTCVSTSRTYHRKHFQNCTHSNVGNVQKIKCIE